MVSKKLVGDRAVLFEFENVISEEVSGKVSSLSMYICEHTKAGTLFAVPAYCSLLLIFDEKKVNVKKLFKLADKWGKQFKKRGYNAITREEDIIEIPCLYGNEYGPDLSSLSLELGFSEEEIIKLHSEVIYPIYMMGFLPGFPYLGGLNEKIHAPRLQTPRKEIKKGSVGIGGSQTGIYPSISPGGWRLIGRTPLTLFNPYEKKALLSVGKKLKFIPISEEEFKRLEKIELEKEAVYKKEFEEKKEKREQMEPLFEVLSPGPMTTVQGFPERENLPLGMTEKGALDEKSFLLSNLILGNSEDSKALELTFSGPKFLFKKDTKICITGADMKPFLNDSSVSMNECIKVTKGDILSFSYAMEGMRTYISFQGGLSEEMGMKLSIGDLLYENEHSETKRIRKGIIKKIQKEIESFQKEKKELGLTRVRVTLGPQDDYFTEKGIHDFLNETYTISAQSNRMGLRLEGCSIESKNGTDIISDGIVNGSIQVPKDGKPIVLLSDHQTTGGYAKIATVVSSDLWKLASLRPGEKLQFVLKDGMV